jgi:hypothetical protein
MSADEICKMIGSGKNSSPGSDNGEIKAVSAF